MGMIGIHANNRVHFTAFWTVWVSPVTVVEIGLVGAIAGLDSGIVLRCNAAMAAGITAAGRDPDLGIRGWHPLATGFDPKLWVCSRPVARSKTGRRKRSLAEYRLTPA